MKKLVACNMCFTTGCNLEKAEGHTAPEMLNGNDMISGCTADTLHFRFIVAHDIVFDQIPQTDWPCVGSWVRVISMSVTVAAFA